MKLQKTLKALTAQRLAEHYAQVFRSNIQKSVDIYGRHLTPLRSGEARRPLLKSGRLMASIVAQNGTVRAAVPYASEASKGRPFMGMPQDLGETLRSLLEK